MLFWGFPPLITAAVVDYFLVSNNSVFHNICCIPTDFQTRLVSIPDGASYVYYNEQKYLLTKETFVGGKTIKLFARSLQGKDHISLNYYMTTKSNFLKPCEMSQKKVIDFVLGFEMEN